MPRLLATLLLILSPAPAFAWNGLGHKVIADIAWRQLDEAKRAEIVATLRRHPRFDQDFAPGMPDADQDRWIFQHAATWPDQIRGKRVYDMPTWHYVNFPLFVGPERQVTFNRETKPKGDRTNWNVIQAVAYKREVIASDASPQNKAITYCWLFHLVGDLHQPRHADSLTADRFPDGERGGNLIPVVQGGNLHALWDGLLGSGDWPNDVKREVAELKSHPSLWRVDTTIDVPAGVAESHKICKSFAYSPEILAAIEQPGDLPPIKLSETYLKEAGDWACHRVVAAGQRLAAVLTTSAPDVLQEESSPLPKAWVDGNSPGWKSLVEADFVAVNCDPNTWSWKNGVLHCTGQPVGVIRSKKLFMNFELVAQWRHLRSGGNSGIFVWTDEAALKDLEPGSLPRGGIEVQVLDHGYTAEYEKSSGQKADWFTTNGDVFPVGSAKMSPFAPTSPNGERSFPRKQLSKGVGDWNHYYIRCLNGEVRLWVNGEEVSGGRECEPRSGYLCLESEGSPVDFRGLRIRELP